MGPGEQSARRPRRAVRIFAASCAGALLLLLVWALAARLIGREIILPAPGRVLDIARRLYPSQRFLFALAATFLRGIVAFALSLCAGLVVGLASGHSETFRAFVSPLLSTIRATPVLALILIALIWFPSGFVPIFSAFLMAFPVMSESASAGARAADPKLLEMAGLFRVPGREVFLKLRLPAAAPFLAAGSKAALGLTWKVVVAGEVLSQPLRALGTGMQEARVLLETGEVFAWAAASILLCGASDWIFGLLARRLVRE